MSYLVPKIVTVAETDGIRCAMSGTGLSIMLWKRYAMPSTGTELLVLSLCDVRY